MPTAGDTTTVTATGPAGAPDASLTVVDPTGAISRPTVTETTGTPGEYTAVLPLPMPGVWYLTWTLAGTTVRQSLPVGTGGTPPPGGWFAYATSADLAQSPYWTEPEPPADADRQLAVAADEIDRQILTAVYDTDTDGKPTDPDVAAALRDASCALVAWWAETGDESGAGVLYGSVGIGSVNLSRATGTNAPPAAASRVGPQVVQILGRAGLLAHLAEYY